MANRKDYLQLMLLMKKAPVSFSRWKKKEDNWKILTAQLPAWVTENEGTYNEIIEEEFKSV